MLALDIGGANLKAADGHGFGHARYFPLWQRPRDLADELADIVDHAPPADRLVVTMTGELADCYATKADGVRAIVLATQSAAGDRQVEFYTTAGGLVSAEQAVAEPLLVAASNWHALAAFAAAQLPEQTGLLIDIGSTTCDVIPLVGGLPMARGHTDPERLLHGELVYTGVVRSPLCGLVEALPWHDAWCPVAQEVFATTWDAYLWLRDLPEQPDARHTADGRPATRACAHDRLARSICADRTMFSADDARRAARHIRDVQQALIEQAVRQVAAGMHAMPRGVVVSGQGEFLAHRVGATLPRLDQVVSMSRLLGPQLSQVATAHALAVLAQSIAPPKCQPPRIAPPEHVPRRVVKLGGSLLDMPDLTRQLNDWLALQSPAETLLLAGGGALADSLRTMDRLHHVGESAAHWLCVRALAIHAEMLGTLLPEARPWPGVSDLLQREPRPGLIIVDAERFLREDEPRVATAPLPETWAVTTDSIAARLARVVDADELVLLKSTLPPSGQSVDQWAASGFVDDYFPTAWQGGRGRVVNFRQQPYVETPF